MKWFFRKWRENQIVIKLTPKQTNDSLKMLALPPLRNYLVALMDELVRQGLYLDSEKQEGAKYTIDLLTEQIRRGEAIIKKENKK